MVVSHPTTQVEFFMSMVTTVLDDRAGDVQRMLAGYVEREPSEYRCARMAQMADIGPQMVVAYVRRTQFALPPHDPALAELAPLFDAIQARLAGDREALRAAHSAIADLHDADGCDSISALILMAVCLCADLHIRHWKAQAAADVAAPLCPPAAPPPGCALQE